MAEGRTWDGTERGMMPGERERTVCRAWFTDSEAGMCLSVRGAWFTDSERSAPHPSPGAYPGVLGGTPEGGPQVRTHEAPSTQEIA